MGKLTARINWSASTRCRGSGWARLAQCMTISASVIHERLEASSHACGYLLCIRADRRKSTAHRKPSSTFEVIHADMRKRRRDLDRRWDACRGAFRSLACTRCRRGGNAYRACCWSALGTWWEVRRAASA